MIDAPNSSSTRPYLIRALYEWCTDNGFTPYVAVQVDDTVQVPREYVKDGEIVLNISFDATSGLKLGNEFIEFNARFAGTAREIMVPMDRVIAIYARENGQGMAFPIGNSVAAGGKRPEPAPRGVDAPADADAAGSGAKAGSDAEGKKLVKLTPAPAASSTPGGGTPLTPPDPSRPKPTLTRIK